MKDWQTFKALLDEQYTWPCLYLFKFILPQTEMPQIRNLFPDEELQIRPSKKGQYVSVTVWSLRNSSEEVIETYEKAKNIKGIMSL